MRRIKILIFDDEVSILNLYKVIMKPRGYDVETYGDPSHCPLYDQPDCDCPLDEPCCDIIITDMRMPKVNGLEFIKTQKEKGCKVKHIALVSAYSDDEIIKEAQSLGVTFLKKPFSLKDLDDWLDECERKIKD